MILTPLRVAFIGAGQMARQHLQIVSRRSGATIVGVHDRAPGQAAQLAAMAGTHAYPSIAALMREARPDVVHVCTPPAAHFEAAHAALESGAHVYIEKPFALTVRDARALLELASSRGLIVCSGHQLLCDPAFQTLAARASTLGRIVQADSHFAFRPVQVRAARAGARALADQALDILPHPLYTLIAALEQFGAANTIECDWAHAGPADLQAILRAGDIVGRLSVSLRARPVASSLTLIGTNGSLTCDFVRSIVFGVPNTGTEALEKILNPMVEGAQLVSRTAASLTRRLRTGIAYPGLRELIDAFHDAVASGAPSPISPAHLLRVTDIFERLVTVLQDTVPRTMTAAVAAHTAPVTVVTGASGFLGSEIARALPCVRGIGRGPNPEHPHIREWVSADLSSGLTAEALAGADLVVHAAAETAGGYEAHQRNTIDATRHLLHAMRDARIGRLILVSSLSVLRPPRTPWERQDEQTPRPDDPRPLGAYTWGKCRQEELVEREAPALGIAVRIIRPGALIDAREPTLPGLMGRRLFGRWHLGIGRAGLPIGVCDVERCAYAIAWCATHFDEAPPVVNLFDPDVRTRGALVNRMRADGWNGRILWVPVSMLALGLTAARTSLSLIHGRLPARLAAWSILRPRHYDARLAASLLDPMRRHEAVLPAPRMALGTDAETRRRGDAGHVVCSN